MGRSKFRAESCIKEPSVALEGKINEVINYSLRYGEHDWNGEGGKPIKLETCQRAVSIIRAFAADEYFGEHFVTTPGGNGSIGIVWLDESGRVHVSVKPDLRVQVHIRGTQYEEVFDQFTPPSNIVVFADMHRVL